MSKTLYELTGQMKAIEDALEENGGELTEELEALWQETAESLPMKIDGYSQVIANYEAYSRNLDAEIKRLQALKKTSDNSAKRVKEHLKQAMLANGIQKLDGYQCKVSLSSTTATEVDEETVLAPYIARLERLMLPAWITAELKVSKTALKEAFKDSDVTPAGVRFVKNTQLRMK